MDEQLNADQQAEIDGDVVSGRKTGAIKRYREITGVDLKDAKEAVEKRQAALQAEHPEKFTRTAGKGCLALIACVGLAGLACLTALCL